MNGFPGEISYEKTCELLQEHGVIHGLTWLDRRGVQHKVTGIVARDAADAREIAIAEHDYPGHEGGWWNYFVDDSHAFLMRLFKKVFDQ